MWGRFTLVLHAVLWPPPVSVASSKDVSLPLQVQAEVVVVAASASNLEQPVTHGALCQCVESTLLHWWRLTIREFGHCLQML